MLNKERENPTATFFGSDSLISDETNPDTAYASPEPLHGLNIPGVPSHELVLQNDALAMLARNLNFSEGLVNGHKAVIRALSPNCRVVQVQLVVDRRKTNSTHSAYKLSSKGREKRHHVPENPISVAGRIFSDNQQVTRINPHQDRFRFEVASFRPQSTIDLRSPEPCSVACVCHVPCVPKSYHE